MKTNTSPATNPNSTVVPAATSTMLGALGGLAGRVLRRYASDRAASGGAPLPMIHIDVDRHGNLDDPHLPSLGHFGGTFLRLNGPATRNLLVDARQEAIDPLCRTIVEDARAIPAARFIQISDSLNEGSGAGQLPVVGAAAILAGRHAILDTINAPLSSLSRGAGERGRILVVATAAGAMACGGSKPFIEMLHKKHGSSCDIEIISILPGTILSTAMNAAAFEKQSGPLAQNTAAHLRDLEALLGGGDQPKAPVLKRAFLIGDTDDSGQRIASLEELLELTAQFISAYVDGGLGNQLARTSATNQVPDAPGTFIVVGISAMTVNAALRVPAAAARATAIFWTRFVEQPASQSVIAMVPTLPESPLTFLPAGEAAALLRMPLSTLHQKLTAQRAFWREQAQTQSATLPVKAQEYANRVADAVERSLAQGTAAGYAALTNAVTLEANRIANRISQVKANLDALPADSDKIETKRRFLAPSTWFAATAKRELANAEAEMRINQQRANAEWKLSHLNAGREALAEVKARLDNLKPAAELHAAASKGQADKLDAAVISTDRICDVATGVAFVVPDLTPDFQSANELTLEALNSVVIIAVSNVTENISARATVKAQLSVQSEADKRRLAERTLLASAVRLSRVGGAQSALTPSKHVVGPRGALAGEFSTIVAQHDAGWIASVELMHGVERDSIHIPNLFDGETPAPNRARVVSVRTLSPAQNGAEHFNPATR